MTHQNSIYEATVPVALYVAAILNHPATAAGEHALEAGLQLRHRTREMLLDRLGSTAYDADDERVAMGERYFGFRGGLPRRMPRHAGFPGPAPGDLPRRSPLPHP
ncbi:hypothetical protein [Streptomyces sp. SID14515]|uniref:hypothetical protein n=1 Tax=Streptomyces sp. SID14515 TaxID=2706074 RepID=UPI0019436DDE|nr:hypothetical protein [Streptomyces sp. SID14515]